MRRWRDRVTRRRRRYGCWLGAVRTPLSTVPEVLVARALGLRCLAFSLITNRAAGLSSDPLSHDEVLETGLRAGGRLQALVRRVVRQLPRRDGE